MPEVVENPSEIDPASDVDVIIVGAGISGIGTACMLADRLPDVRFLILERRSTIGGTWDLFRYPGIRSDSDMFTFGFGFRPWSGTRVLADGSSIRQYIQDTAEEYGVTDRIRFGTRVVGADWSSADQAWTVTAQDEATGEPLGFRANFMVAATGYYDYDEGYRPEFPGEDRFTGQIVHPQHWPEDLDYHDKRVVVIGSGATAVTLVPAMAPDAAHVTMLQRSPTYILSLPAVDKISETMARFLPDKLVWQTARARNVAIQRAMFNLCRRYPEKAKEIIVGQARKQLGTRGNIADFTPSYDPWDQRLCIVPDGDLFRCIRNGSASVVTDTISTFTEDGIELASGKHLPADIIITATGLQVRLLGKVAVTVDGEPVRAKDRLTYRAVMLAGVPNHAVIFGYTNASWTLKAELVANYITRLLEHMRRKGYTTVVADAGGELPTDETVLGSLDSGYIRRAADELPRQGRSGVWRVVQSYLHDRPYLGSDPIEDGHLVFGTADDRPSRTTEQAEPLTSTA